MVPFPTVNPVVSKKESVVSKPVLELSSTAVAEKICPVDRHVAIEKTGRTKQLRKYNTTDPTLATSALEKQEYHRLSEAQGTGGSKYNLVTSVPPTPFESRGGVGQGLC
jgi:hypothetical protein